MTEKFPFTQKLPIDDALGALAAFNRGDAQFANYLAGRGFTAQEYVDYVDRFSGRLLAYLSDRQDEMARESRPLFEGLPELETNTCPMQERLIEIQVRQALLEAIGQLASRTKDVMHEMRKLRQVLEKGKSRVR